MNSIISSLLVSAAVLISAPEPLDPNHGVNPGVGPGIHRPEQMPRPPEPGFNGVRPGVGPAAQQPGQGKPQPQVRPDAPGRDEGKRPQAKPEPRPKKQR